MTERTPAAGKRMLDTPSTKDEIAVQHRPENAGSRHSALRPTEADGEKRGGDPKAGPKPDSDEVDPDRNVDTDKD